VRVLLRQQRLDDACQALQAIPLAPPGDASSALRQLALGEYHIEANEVAAARAALTQALARLPEELVEERIQASQSLAFVFISLVDLPRALRHLQQARAMLRGAGSLARGDPDGCGAGQPVGGAW
jgi:tetratricopeptide (TPR) repeat protein